MLDSEALSGYLRADRRMTARLAVAAAEGIRVVASAVTIVEADSLGVHPARLDWTLARLAVVPVSRDLARSASALLKTASLHGHTHAIDAMVVATALAAEDRPATILTSDPRDIAALLADRLDRRARTRSAASSGVRVQPV